MSIPLYKKKAIEQIKDTELDRRNNLNYHLNHLDLLLIV